MVWVFIPLWAPIKTRNYMLTKNNPVINQMYRDAIGTGEYTAKLANETPSPEYSLFKGWNTAKIVLKFCYGAKTLNKHELALRKMFIQGYKSHGKIL
jgi:hypothetical protein